MSILNTATRALACLALLLGAATAQASSFAYTSTAGEPLGGGVGTRVMSSPTATFDVYSNQTFVMLDIDQAGEHWNIQFRAPTINGSDEALHRGIYTGAEHAAFPTAHAPGLEILGPVNTCLDVYGAFNIRQIDFDWTGTLRRLEATFSHRCGGAGAPLLTGTIYYDALPRSYSYTRTGGVPLGTGSNKNYFGDTSDVGAGGFPQQMDWHVSGQQDDWDFIATAPTGQEFTKGKTYQLAMVEDDTHAGLAIEWNQHPRCTTSLSGTLRIYDIATFDGNGEIRGLHATYTLRCNGSSATYTGTIRYGL